MKRDFLSITDLSREELLRLLDRAEELKRLHREGRSPQTLAGKTLAMIFEKPSTRTRVSFEAGMFQLGGHALFLGRGELQLGRGETIADTARILSEYADALLVRTFAHEGLEELARAASVPVINGLTDLLHPCQVLSDALTIRKHLGRLEGVRLAYIGDGNNVAHSLLLAGARLGFAVTVASPEGFEPRAEVLARARSLAVEPDSLQVVRDPRQAARGADVLYTDVWVSMGQEGEANRRRSAFGGYRVEEALFREARPDAIFMHCLPAHRGEEVSAEVLDGPRSAVIPQAGNRLHTHKALLEFLMGGSRSG
ncbi:MAG: ornithine carbamoyltransferase [Nitrospinota bacterium]